MATPTPLLVALTSDTHGYLPTIADDVAAVIHAGDIGVDRDPATWFKYTLYPWAAKVKVPIYATFGNHDRIGERQLLPEGKPSNLHFLVDEFIELEGVNVWFTPWSKRYGDWAYMANERTLALKYAQIPLRTEVIVSHGPPFQHGDLTLSGERAGSVSLLDRCHQLDRLRLVVTGHIHEAVGHYPLGEKVTVSNVSHVNEYYEPTHHPHIVVWPPWKE